MSAIDSLLNQRTKKNESSSKMAAMAQKSASGGLSGFVGMFSMSELSEGEKSTIETLLKDFCGDEIDFKKDLTTLLSLTAEVKAINNQAILLHGERIKKVQSLLTSYRDGAFTAWLIAAYGNRQTPYNFLQYYEFYEATPKNLHSKIELMPRQAIYVLATREGDLGKKQEIVKNYGGESKEATLKIIRETFPLEMRDKRKQNQGNYLIKQLGTICACLRGQEIEITSGQKRSIKALLNELNTFIQ
jgi:hypothetical protein